MVSRVSPEEAGGGAPTGPRGVIVTGGTGALGRAVVLRLLARGARVAVPYRDEKDWRALQERAGGGPALFGAAAELADARKARAFVDEAAAAMGVLDGVALAAGGWTGGKRFDEAPEDEWPGMLSTNLSTVAHVCRAALP